MRIDDPLGLHNHLPVRRFRQGSMERSMEGSIGVSMEWSMEYSMGGSAGPSNAVLKSYRTDGNSSAARSQTTPARYDVPTWQHTTYLATDNIPAAVGLEAAVQAVVASQGVAVLPAAPVSRRRPPAAARRRSGRRQWKRGLHLSIVTVATHQLLINMQWRVQAMFDGNPAMESIQLWPI